MSFRWTAKKTKKREADLPTYRPLFAYHPSIHPSIQLEIVFIIITFIIVLIITTYSITAHLQNSYTHTHTRCLNGPWSDKLNNKKVANKKARPNN